MMRPTHVRRGSSSRAQIGPDSCSASTRMLRNFNMVKGLPPKPIRSCRKNIGPLLVALTSTARISMGAAKSSNSPRAPTMSTIRFTTACQPSTGEPRR